MRFARVSDHVDQGTDLALLRLESTLPDGVPIYKLSSAPALDAGERGWLLYLNSPANASAAGAFGAERAHVRSAYGDLQVWTRRRTS